MYKYFNDEAKERILNRDYDPPIFHAEITNLDEYELPEKIYDLLTKQVGEDTITALLIDSHYKTIRFRKETDDFFLEECMILKAKTVSQSDYGKGVWMTLTEEIISGDAPNQALQAIYDWEKWIEDHYKNNKTYSNFIKFKGGMTMHDRATLSYIELAETPLQEIENTFPKLDLCWSFSAS